MNTATEKRAPLLPQIGVCDYEYCLEDLELAFNKGHLAMITQMWNEGADIEVIAKKFRRDPDEIFLALFHQGRKKKITRSIWDWLLENHMLVKKLDGAEYVCEPPTKEG